MWWIVLFLGRAGYIEKHAWKSWVLVDPCPLETGLDLLLLSARNWAFVLCFLAVSGIVFPYFPLPFASVNHGIHSDLTRHDLSALSPTSTIATISSNAEGKVPVIQGWGGVTLEDASNGQMQLTLLMLNQSGYNGVRVGFGAGITKCSSGELGPWNMDWFNETVQLAQQYNTWVVLDYHGYSDLVDSACQTSWLSFWNGVLSTNWNYDRIIWEPINEPVGSVSLLSSAYQAWITQARSLHDNHWIAIENTLSSGNCSFDPTSLASCYPKTTDPLSQTLLSVHPYLFYNVWQGGGYGICSPSSTRTWNNTTAECVANIYDQAMQIASATYHMHILDTEGGTIYNTCKSGCEIPPDAVGTNDASYSKTTLHFIQYLTSLMDSQNMGWLWWEAGEGTCCGALDTWGSSLKFQPVNPPVANDNPPSLTAPTGNIAIEGSILSFQVNASDPDTPPETLTLSCAICPAGAVFPSTSSTGRVTGIFSWTPSLGQGGKTYNVTFTVVEGQKSSSATIRIMVYPANSPPHKNPPILIIPGNQTVTASSTLKFNITAIDSDPLSQTLVLDCANCASLGATFSSVTSTFPVTGTLNWAPGSGRVPRGYELNFTVTNGLNMSTATVPVYVDKAKLQLAASVYPRAITIGISAVSVFDIATLLGGFDPTGTITFSVFSLDRSCTGTPLFTSTLSVNKNGNYQSEPFIAQDPGRYQWEASYTGDQNNRSTSTPCGSSIQTLTISSAPGPQPQSPTLANPSIFSQSVFWLAIGGGGAVIAAGGIMTVLRRRSKKVEGC